MPEPIDPLNALIRAADERMNANHTYVTLNYRGDIVEVATRVETPTDPDEEDNDATPDEPDTPRHNFAGMALQALTSASIIRVDMYKSSTRSYNTLKRAYFLLPHEGQYYVYRAPLAGDAGARRVVGRAATEPDGMLKFLATLTAVRRGNWRYDTSSLIAYWHGTRCVTNGSAVAELQQARARTALTQSKPDWPDDPFTPIILKAHNTFSTTEWEALSRSTGVFVDVHHLEFVSRARMQVKGRTKHAKVSLLLHNLAPGKEPKWQAAPKRLASSARRLHRLAGNIELEGWLLRDPRTTPSVADTFVACDIVNAKVPFNERAKRLREMLSEFDDDQTIRRAFMICPTEDGPNARRLMELELNDRRGQEWIFLDTAAGFMAIPPDRDGERREVACTVKTLINLPNGVSIYEFWSMPLPGEEKKHLGYIYSSTNSSVEYARLSPSGSFMFTTENTARLLLTRENATVSAGVL